ncbi:hypothetical protein OG738_24810 [Amycolatopsis sp. NBC_01488]|uniref:hypothetical protein n=1 Tax=Amycolatopsis sp. NBC_01488 TaxID=2903563 RepID=UPI002E2E40FC|nr:hypothetical protein [Amycolatopsis sp. NBC_01488]
MLDVFGPVYLLSVVPDRFDVRFVGPGRAPVASSQGISVSVTDTRDDAPEPGIILEEVRRGGADDPIGDTEAFQDRRRATVHRHDALRRRGERPSSWNCSATRVRRRAGPGRPPRTPTVRKGPSRPLSTAVFSPESSSASPTLHQQ